MSAPTFGSFEQRNRVVATHDDIARKVWALLNRFRVPWMISSTPANTGGRCPENELAVFLRAWKKARREGQRFAACAVAGVIGRAAETARARGSVAGPARGSGEDRGPAPHLVRADRAGRTQIGRGSREHAGHADVRLRPDGAQPARALVGASHRVVSKAASHRRDARISGPGSPPSKPRG